MSEQRFTLSVSANLLLEKNNKILLHLRYNTGYKDGFYSVVSGHLDGNETVREAMVREVYEEAGIIIKLEDLQVVHVMHHNSNKEFVHFFLRCTQWTGTITNVEPHKCAELCFFDKNKLPFNMVPYVQFAIEHINNNYKYSEFEWEKRSLIEKNYEQRTRL